MTKHTSPIVAYAQEVLQIEAQAIQQAIPLLDENFEHAIRLLLGLNAHSHVITSGIGKAGFIAMKISATLASIGIPSFFLHPAEAVHGDIGRFTKSDAALILSNSGATPEILAMLPNIKRIGCPIVAMTADLHSDLARHSDVVLNIGRCTEAGPLGLAPTTSTTVMLALGDALAMTLLKEKGLTREEYAFFHPGGSLGRSLLLTREVMRQGDELCIVPETMIVKDVLHAMTLTKGRPGAAIVQAADGTLAGIFTNGDVRRFLEKDPSFLTLSISQCMGRTPKTITEEKLACEASHLMGQFKIDELIVIDKANKPIGMIDIQDLWEIKL